ncbi:hypothetical protein [Saccharopolyspora mangrovi]|uniref:Uncharacterized protein n=1 Tax=Saccharopolyspora mangrovi TaxID=3082379 RepID=A0ABU6ADC3_9PSEU|nr:hypothetical protein [Saccharopolyspora sp. S2-29]MEB3369546.1 hypothetical protein [Saccharopolyspora sp. S2-29]
MQVFFQFLNAVWNGLGFLTVLAVVNFFVLFFIAIGVASDRYSKNKLDKVLDRALAAALAIGAPIASWIVVFPAIQGVKATPVSEVRPWIGALGFAFALICAEVYMITIAISWNRSIIHHDSQLRLWIEPQNEKEAKVKIGQLLRVSFLLRNSWVPFALASAQMGIIFLVLRYGRPATELTKLALMSIVLLGLVAAISLPRLLATISPSEGVASHCLAYFVGKLPKPLLFEMSPVGASRWRTSNHKHGFYSAKYLLRSLNGIRNKIPQEIFGELDDTYRKIGNRLAVESLILGDGAVNKKYGDMCASLLALVANSNLVETRDAAARLVTVDDVKLSKPASRFSKVAVKLDGFMQRHSRVLMAALGVVVVMGLLATGKLGEVLNFGRDLVLQSGAK